MRDPWLDKAPPRRQRTWAEQARRFRALRVPADVYDTLTRWTESPDALEPVFRLVRDLVVSNAVHRAQMKRTRWAAGTARDPYYKLTPEKPGALRPVLDLVERVIDDLERLIRWQFNPPIELHELDEQLTPTGRRVRLARLTEHLRDAFARARSPLLGVRDDLRVATRRLRGRKATLVQPFRVSSVSGRREAPKPARRRQLEQMLGDQLLRLHPDRDQRPRGAQAAVRRMARRLIRAIL